MAIEPREESTTVTNHQASDAAEEFALRFWQDLHSLPPLVERHSEGGVRWQHFGEVDFETIGCLLTCHLLVEHYIDHYLKLLVDEPLDWPGARLQFSQKLALLANRRFSGDYALLPGIRHLNTLRNKIAHNVGQQLTAEDVRPLLATIPRNVVYDALSPRLALLAYTQVVCAYFAGAVATLARKGVSQGEVKAEPAVDQSAPKE